MYEVKSNSKQKFHCFLNNINIPKEISSFLEPERGMITGTELLASAMLSMLYWVIDFSGSQIFIFKLDHFFLSFSTVFTEYRLLPTKCSTLVATMWP